MKAEKRGGNRAGAGRKPGVTFKPKTKTITVRIDAEKLAWIKETYGDELSPRIRVFIESLYEK